MNKDDIKQFEADLARTRSRLEKARDEMEANCASNQAKLELLQRFARALWYFSVIAGGFGLLSNLVLFAMGGEPRYGQIAFLGVLFVVLSIYARGIFPTSTVEGEKRQ